jgi:hypothetical protein
MRLAKCGLLGLSLSVVAACDAGGNFSSSGQALGVADGTGEEFPELNQDAGEPPGEDEQDPPNEQYEPSDCPQGGDVGPIRVVFECDEIVVITCKDLSNVVIELDDGSHHKTQGLQGHVNRFDVPAGHEIVGVWVKSGENKSGDGPGYGERFDAPDDACTPPNDDGSEEPPTDVPPEEESPDPGPID